MEGSFAVPAAIPVRQRVAICIRGSGEERRRGGGSEEDAQGDTGGAG